LKVCYRCDHDIYPKGKILFDYAADNAVQDKNGNWKCLDCVKHDADNDIIRYAPNSLAAKEIIAERKRKEDFKARYERVRKQSGNGLLLIRIRDLENIHEPGLSCLLS
jgi:hypothetical protein